MYNVDEYAADPRAAFIFRVQSGGDGIGPEVISHGFAYMPKPEGRVRRGALSALPARQRLVWVPRVRGLVLTANRRARWPAVERTADFGNLSQATVV
jgi:hypothetical protein